MKCGDESSSLSMAVLHDDYGAVFLRHLDSFILRVAIDDEYLTRSPAGLYISSTTFTMDSSSFSAGSMTVI